jgi:uncharacterized protein
MVRRAVRCEPGAMEDPEQLSYATCRQLLARGVLGRCAVCTPRGPVILPVNYSVVAEAIIFRTSRDGMLARHVPGSLVAFEADHIDYTENKGWSVLATGRGESVTDATELANIVRTWEPRPWAGGDRPLYLRLAWDELTGRRLGQEWTDRSEMPLRHEP